MLDVNVWGVSACPTSEASLNGQLSSTHDSNLQLKKIIE